MNELPHTAFSLRIDRLLTFIGELSGWLWIALLVVIVANVLMRYVFGEGRIEFEELQWHIYAVGFLLGLSYANVKDAHVRVDVVRVRLSLQLQAWIELYGILILLMPFLALVLFYSPAFTGYSWSNAEVSEAPGGLPYRWAIKSVLFVAFVLLLLSALSRLSRVLKLLFGAPS